MTSENSSISVQALQEKVGQELGVSRWFEVDQSRIDAFSDSTEDWQFIHTDPEAAKETPFGGTIAHGFLTLSLLSAMSMDANRPVEGMARSINYGFNRIRFVSPVMSGARIRGRFELVSIGIGDDHIRQTQKVTVEIEGSDRPALVAEWVTRQYF